MPVILEANYSKKVGLPGYSSHQYSITLRTEITDLTQVSNESQRLYALLQGCVDRDIQQTGFLPQNGEANHSNGRAAKNSSDWGCSDKQRDLILKIIDDNRLDKQRVESLAVERFGKGVKLLNKLEASGLIEELLEAHPQPSPRSVAPRRNANGNGRYQPSRS
ncbi:MAG TPA: hypothetical protein VMZ27_11315 [Candidatus Saccharimonadales bacterium]|nr:hypothetical protein [Candidatus Saccharimonadales bacterium]